MKDLSGARIDFSRAIEPDWRTIMYRSTHPSQWTDISLGYAIQGVRYLETAVEKDREYNGVMEYMCDFLIFLSGQAHTLRQKMLIRDLITRVIAVIRE